MPQYNPAFQGLASLKTNPKPATGSLYPDYGAIYGAKLQQKDNIDDSLFQARRSGDANWERALGGLAKGIEEDIASDPLTAQKAQVADFQDREREAILNGYGGGAQQGNQYLNPIQAQANAARQSELEKMRQPLEMARVNQQGALAQQQEQSRGGIEQARVQGQGQLGVAQENHRGAMAIQDKFNELQKTLGVGGVGNQQVAGVTMPSRSGGGSIRFQAGKQIPPGISNALLGARSQFQQTGDPAVLNQAIQNALSYYQFSHPNLRNDVSKFMTDPRTSNLTDINQIIQVLTQAGDIEPGGVTPDEMEEYQGAINMLHGGF